MCKFSKEHFFEFTYLERGPGNFYVPTKNDKYLSEALVSHKNMQFCVYASRHNQQRYDTVAETVYRWLSLTYSLP